MAPASGSHADSNALRQGLPGGARQDDSFPVAEQLGQSTPLTETLDAADTEGAQLVEASSLPGSTRTAEYAPVSITEAAAKIARDQTAAHDAKLAVFRVFSESFEQAAKQFMSGPDNSIAKQVATRFLNFWKQSLSELEEPMKPTYSSALASGKTPKGQLAVTASAPQRTQQTTTRLPGRPPVTPPKEDLRVFVRLDADAPARNHERYAIRTHIAARVGIDLRRIPAAFPVNTGWAIQASDAATGDMLVQRQEDCAVDLEATAVEISQKWHSGHHPSSPSSRPAPTEEHCHPNDDTQATPSQWHPRQQRPPDSTGARHREGQLVLARRLSICQRCHSHGPGRLPPTGQTRVAHCGRSSYQLFYPFEDHPHAQYSYRVDKTRGLFVTVGVALPSDDEDEESEAAEDGNEVRKGDDDENDAEEPEESGSGSRSSEAETGDSDHDQLQKLEHQVERLAIGDKETPEAPSSDKIWEELMGNASHQQKLLDSHCILNDLHGVAALLETYKDDPFVSYKNKVGDNCITLAAVEGHDKMIQFLHSKGGDLNNADSRGQTPLMMAALWGRLKAVDYLLDHGANPCAMDLKGYSAYFYSRPLRRMRRLRDEFGNYQESNEAEINRRFIAVRLQAYEPATASDGAASSGTSNEVKVGHFITKTTDFGTQISFYEQRVAYDVPDGYKTVARLDRGSLFSVMSAASGWRTDFATEHILDNRLWRNRVLELCQLIGYALPEHARDQAGWPGSYLASHAEKKLVAFYIYQHVILPSALLEDVAIDQRGEWVEQDLRLQHLEVLCPRIPTVPASIRASRPICEDCELFISRVGTVFSTSFVVEHC
ncbi:hypothetical protein HIM_09850 [Hirsutella minnesotensis 3608]|uniref:Single-strand DNA deaminase toxin A-like C-terminal domain-containing protein n=1 Tax=Hirsutella minnesotensis 3608 TaxID=1043627 RepID=A0A0F7ZGE8_9HYPO|nr:hypothetical protein HIM_09850 [Hirsutella minnesotensis 3608]